MSRTALVILLAAALFGAGGAWLTCTAPTALAPEPARLASPLVGGSGATAPGVYVESGGTTTVVKWPSTWTPGSVAAGTLCTVGNLATGAEVSLAIRANGNYRRCL